MATTEKGIYYPNNYNEVADIPADMKEMAESIDDVLKTMETGISTDLDDKVDKIPGKGLSTNDYTDEDKQQLETNTQDISDIRAEQITQNNNINDLQAENTALQAENTRLRNDIEALSSEETQEGESITFENVSGARFKELGISGKSEQSVGDVTEEGEVVGVMPSPEFPSEIRNCGDNVNLFDEALLKQEPNYNTYNEETRMWTTSDFGAYCRSFLYKATGTDITRKVQYLPEMPINEDITITIYDLNKSSDSLDWYVAFVDDTGTKIGDRIDSNFNSIVVKTPNQKCHLDIGRVNSSGTFSFSKIKIEKGTKATPYSKYNCGNVNEVISNKNLLNPEEFAQKVINNPYNSSNISIYDKETGALNIRMGDNRAVFDRFKKGTQYTFIFKYDINYGTETNLRVVYTDGMVANIVGATGNGVIKFISVAGKSIKFLQHSAANSTGTRTLYLFESGIFEGVIDESEFIAPQTQNITFPLSEGQKLMQGDYLAEDGIHHLRGQYTVTGNETFEIYINGTYTNNPYFVFRKSGVKASYSPLSNYFKGGNITSTTNGYTQCTPNQILLQPSNGIITVADLKTWLSEQYANGTPVIVEYELAEEVIEPYTAEQQAVWDYMQQVAHSYEGKTYIYSEDEISATVHATAQIGVKQIQSQIENIASAVVALGGELNV